MVYGMTNKGLIVGNILYIPVIRNPNIKLETLNYAFE